MTTQIKVTTREFGEPAMVEFLWLCDDYEMRPISFDCELVYDESGDIELLISNISGDCVAATEMVRISRAMYAHDGMVNAVVECKEHQEKATREDWYYLAEVLADVAKSMIKAYHLDWQVEAVLFRVAE